MKEKIYIDVDLYDKAFSEWAIQVYGRAVNNYDIMSRFDQINGLEENYHGDISSLYCFLVIDKKRYMLAKLKYGF